MQHELERQAEKRRAPRRHTKVRVLYISKGLPRAVDSACENISLHGLFIKTRRRGPGVGTPVSLILDFEDLGEVMVEGIVRWQGSVHSLDDGTEGAGMGIEFVDLAPEARQALVRSLGAQDIQI